MKASKIDTNWTFWVSSCWRSSGETSWFGKYAFPLFIWKLFSFHSNWRRMIRFVGRNPNENSTWNTLNQKEKLKLNKMLSSNQMKSKNCTKLCAWIILTSEINYDIHECISSLHAIVFSLPLQFNVQFVWLQQSLLIVFFFFYFRFRNFHFNYSQNVLMAVVDPLFLFHLLDWSITWMFQLAQIK